MKKIIFFLLHITSIFCFNLAKADSLDVLRKQWHSIPTNKGKAARILEFVDKHKLDNKVKLPLLKEAMGLMPKNGTDTISARLSYKLGQLFYANEDYVQSFEYFNHALKAFQKNSNKYWIATTYLQLGNVYERQEQLEDAERVFLQTQKIAKEIHSNQLMAYSYNSLSIIFDKRGKSQQALELSLLGLKYLKAAKLNDDYLTGLVNVAIHYKNMGEFGKAIAIYEEALQLPVAQRDTFALAAININLAWAYEGKRDLDKGIKVALKGIELSSNIDERKYFQSDAYKVLAKLYEADKQWNRAYWAYKNHVALNDSITSLEIKSKIVELEEKNKNIEKETRIRELDFQNRNKQNVILSGLALILVLLIAGFMIIRKSSIIRENNDLLVIQNAKIQEQSDKLVLMMKELHHRVKNNLSIVSSLLNLQTYRLTDQEAIRAVQTGQKRVEAMSLIHQRLYQTDNSTSLNIKEYILDLVENIMESYGYTKQNFQLALEIDHTDIDIDLAIPLGLILNELVTNSFKHAYRNIPNPRLEISFKKTESSISLRVKDNGTGLDLEKWNSKVNRSFGKQLIVSLSKQVNGLYTLENEDGAIFQLEISTKSELI